jgi:NADPH-dependent 2,4-dienoyl-CoA reductase/sulfur reductase-like enzyme
LLALVKAGWPVAGQRVVVAGSGPVLLAAAAALPAHGAQVRVVAEQAPRARVARFGLGLWRYPEKLQQGAALAGSLLGVPYLTGCWPLRAEGDERVERVSLTDGSQAWMEECDLLACGFHLVPNLEWPLLLGCRLEGGAVWVNAEQETSVASVYCAGEGTGIAGAEGALVQGCVAGLAAAGETAAARGHFAARARWRRFGAALEATFAPRAELRRLAAPDTLVCRCEDVPSAALDAHADWRSAKLHTRCGMGACQGRVCGAATEFLYGWENRSVRPPIFPVRVGALMPGAAPAKTSP